jgi:dipeptidyl aminopeptidase/acylaminoacyl peptidase
VTYVSTGTTSRYLLHTVTVDGRRVERIVDDEYTSPQMPDWSPSGDRLAFVARHPTDGTWGVWVRDQATGAATQLTRVAPPCPQGCDAWPTFTPDGLHVLFVRGRMLHAVPAAGGAAVALSGVTSSDTPSKAGVAADALVWTTGGTQVISATPPAWSVTAASLRFQLGGGTSWMATRPGTSALAFHAGGQGVSVTTTQGDRPRLVAAQPGRELSWSDGW